MLGGFTFKKIHSSEYNVRETPSSNVLFPLKRRELITIPGSSRAFIQEDGGYEPKQIGLSCSYEHDPEDDIYEQVRLIAGWLDGIGELTFDFEPDLHYKAFLSSSPPSVTMLEFAHFSLDFTINPPFAYGALQQEDEDIKCDSIGSLEVEAGGTTKAPLRLILQLGQGESDTLTDLTLTHTYIDI